MSVVNDLLPIVLSIRPTYVERILRGDKTVELRRRFPLHDLSDRIALIYSTSPAQAIVALARLQSVEQLNISALWKLYGNAAAVTREEFDSYFRGAKAGYALFISDVVRFRRAIHITDLTRQFDFSPPQSYCYWKSSLKELATHGGVKAASRH
ncbi:MAG: hypothetical protein ABUS47_02880 [Steroidobacter sp.]